MKNLYRKGKVHPSPPTISDHLALLPATILTLTVALSPQDKEVLAYLISCSSNNFSGPQKITHNHRDHGPLFQCNCFRCYTSYWVRWDNSPNRQLIHEIIDAYEDGLFQKKRIKKNVKVKKDRRNKVFDVSNDDDQRFGEKSARGELESSCSGEIEVGGEDGEVELEKEKGSSVRKLVSFIGEKLWGVWYK